MNSIGQLVNVQCPCSDRLYNDNDTTINFVFDYEGDLFIPISRQQIYADDKGIIHIKLEKIDRRNKIYE